MDNREELQGRGNISWLLRIISLQAAYVDETLSIKLKIFGRIFLDNRNPRKNKKGKNSKVSKKVRPKESRNVKKQTSNNKIEIQKNNNKFLEENITKEDKNIDISNVNVEPVKEKELKRINEEGFKFSHKIKNIFMKIKNFFQNILLGLQKVKILFRSIGEFLSDLLSKWDKIKAFYNNESNKQGIKKSFLAVKRIVKHILPKKINGSIEFGTGDPCTTGQALGMLAYFYGFYGNSIQVIPNFSDQIFEGSIYIYGRIRIVTLLIIIAKLILDKNFKKLIKNFRAFKEDL